MKKPPSALDDSALDNKDDKKPDRNNEADLPEDSATNWAMGIAPQSEHIPIHVLESLHLAMCRANNLSLDIGNCPVCPNPEACEHVVDKVVGFVTGLHEKRKKNSILKR